MWIRESAVVTRSYDMSIVTQSRDSNTSIHHIMIFTLFPYRFIQNNGTAGKSVLAYAVQESHEIHESQPNTALLCLILALGTFFIAYYLRQFRNSKFLGRSVSITQWTGYYNKIHTFTDVWILLNRNFLHLHKALVGVHSSCLNCKYTLYVSASFFSSFFSVRLV
jgi:hypothetical protein